MRAPALAALLALMAATVHAATLACGTGDSTAALQAALDAGGAVRIEAGTCVVSGTIIVRSGTTLTGAGIGRTTLRAPPGATRAVLAVGGPTLREGARGVDVSGISVDGGAVARGPRRSDAIWVPFGSGDVRLHDLEATDAGDNGIEVNGSDVTVRGVRAHDNYTNGIYVIGKGNAGGLHVVPAARVRVLESEVFDNSRAKPAGSGHAWDGIDFDPITEDGLVQGNRVRHNDIILFENGAVVPWSRGHRVAGNTVEDSPGNGIVVQGPQRDFTVEDNRIERVIGWGIVVNGPARHGVIRGNTVRGTTDVGILVKNTVPQQGAPDDIEISGNTVTVSAHGPGRAGIAARQRASGLRIERNVFPGAGDPATAIDLGQAAPGALVR